jgi:hypothetical protein
VKFVSVLGQNDTILRVYRLFSRWLAENVHFSTALTKMDPPVLTKMDPSFESRGGF